MPRRDGVGNLISEIRARRGATGSVVGDGALFSEDILVGIVFLEILICGL